MQSFVDRYNNALLEDFDGLSPVQMDNLLRGEFHESVVQIKDLEAVYDQVPLVRMIELFLSMIDSEKGLKLTPAGYLPVAIVNALYADAPVKDDAIETGITKLRLEVECEPVHLTRIISELAGYVRKQHGRLYLTRKGKAFRKQRSVLTMLLTLFGERFNLGYLDGYESQSIARVGYRYSLYLLSKYGADKRPETFYAQKYFRAFPQLRTGDAGRDVSCYGIRTFPRFFRYFGFLTETELFTRPRSIQKSDLMDRFVQILA